ncbi:hypothetical protein B4U79_18792, partial [Dinothrombium tinctorium]
MAQIKVLIILVLVALTAAYPFETDLFHSERSGGPLSQQKFASSLNKFSIELLKKICENEENVVYSPFSVWTALGILLKGARQQTAEDIKSLMNLKN